MTTAHNISPRETSNDFTVSFIVNVPILAAQPPLAWVGFGRSPAQGGMPQLFWPLAPHLATGLPQDHFVV